MEIKNRLRRSRRRSEPAVGNRTGGMPSDLGLWDGLAVFITVMMPSTSNGIEDSLTEVSMQ